MMISVVIAAYNEEKTLGPCLDHLLAQTAPGNSYEIIVADDGSTDQTRAVA
jgi:glycosyltransferase involved in cell wall biosynthesis